MSNLIPTPFFIGPDPHDFVRNRLRAILESIRGSVPSIACKCRANDEATQYVSAAIEFENGISVLLACDPEMPQALYEVVRFIEPQAPERYEFEQSAIFGAAFSDKLTSAAVIDLLRAYSAIPPEMPSADVAGAH